MILFIQNQAYLIVLIAIQNRGYFSFILDKKNCRAGIASPAGT